MELFHKLNIKITEDVNQTSLDYEKHNPLSILKYKQMHLFNSFIQIKKKTLRNNKEKINQNFHSVLFKEELNIEIEIIDSNEIFLENFKGRKLLGFCFSSENGKLFLLLVLSISPPLKVVNEADYRVTSAGAHFYKMLLRRNVI